MTLSPESRPPEPTRRPQVRINLEDACDSWIALGEKHVKNHWSLMLIRSFFSGFYLSISSILGLRARVESGGLEILHGVFVSFGIVMIILTDSYLYSEDVGAVFCCQLLKKVTWLQGLVEVAVVYAFNWIGAVASAFFFTHLCGFFSDPEDAIRAALLHQGSEKVQLGVGALIARGVFSTWMLSLAAFLSSRSDLIADKIFAIILPISTLASLGLDHCVISMASLTLCLSLDRHVFSIGRYFYSILVATIANTVGVWVMMSGPAYYVLWSRDRRLRGRDPLPSISVHETQQGDNLALGGAGFDDHW